MLFSVRHCECLLFLNLGVWVDVNNGELFTEEWTSDGAITGHCCIFLHVLLLKWKTVVCYKQSAHTLLLITHEVKCTVRILYMHLLLSFIDKIRLFWYVTHPRRRCCCSQVKLAPREGRSIITTVILGPSRGRIAHTPSYTLLLRYSYEMFGMILLSVWEIRYRVTV